MKTKVSIDQVEHTAQSLQIDGSKVNKLVDDLRKSLEEEAAEPVKREKKQLVVVANIEGLSEDLVSAISEIPMMIVEYPADGDHNQIVPSIHKAAYEYNLSKKGQKKPVTKVLETLSTAQRKFFKPENIGVKSKEISILVTTDNIVPMIEEAGDDEED